MILVTVNLIAFGEGYTQTDFNGHTHEHLPYDNVRVVRGGPQHCIPLIESRLLHADALRSYVQDTMLVNRNSKIVFLEDEKYLMKYNFERLLAIENQKYLDQSQLNANLNRDIKLADKQTKKEKSRKTFWQVVAGLCAGAAVVFAIQ